MWIVHLARENVGARRTLAVLRSEVARDPRLRALARCVEEHARGESTWKSRRDADDPEPPATLDALERLVAAPPRRSSVVALWSWGRRARAADHAEAWRRLLAERDPLRLRRRLTVWARQPPPTMHPRLLELAQHRVRGVRVAASSVLAHVADPRVRRLAIRLLREDPVRAIDDGAIDMLESSARGEDAALVASALPRRASRRTLHDWVSAVRDLSETRRSPAWTALVARTLDVSPCRTCREFALRLLVERGAAHAATLREALLDADLDVREVARSALAATRRDRATARARPRPSRTARGRP